MKTLVYLITCFDKGGAEVQVAKLANHFGQQFRVYVISMIPMSEEWIDLEKQNFTYLDLGMQRGKFSLGGFLHAYRTIKKIKPTLMHSHMVHANLLARLIGFICRIPVVCTAHNVHEVTGPLHKIYRLTKRLAALNTQVSNVGLRKYRNEMLFDQRDITVYNGVQLDVASQPLANSTNNETLTFGYLGKFRAQKNLELLCDVVQKFSERGIDFKLLIAGDGVLKEQLGQWIVERGIEDKIELLGLVNNIDAFFSKIDALLMTSHYEGLPMVLIEAGARNKVCICTEVGGVPEIVEQEKSGLLVEPGNLEQFELAMHRFARMPQEQRLKMGNAAREKIASTFNLEAVLKTWQQIYVKQGLLG